MRQFPLQSDCLSCLLDFTLFHFVLFYFPPAWATLLLNPGVLVGLIFYVATNNSNLNL